MAQETLMSLNVVRPPNAHEAIVLLALASCGEAGYSFLGKNEFDINALDKPEWEDADHCLNGRGIAMVDLRGIEFPVPTFWVIARLKAQGLEHRDVESVLLQMANEGLFLHAGFEYLYPIPFESCWELSDGTTIEAKGTAAAGPLDPIQIDIVIYRRGELIDRLSEGFPSLPVMHEYGLSRAIAPGLMLTELGREWLRRMDAWPNSDWEADLLWQQCGAATTATDDQKRRPDVVSREEAELRLQRIITEKGWPGSLRKAAQLVGCSHETIRHCECAQPYIGPKVWRPRVESRIPIEQIESSAPDPLDALAFAEEWSKFAAGLPPEERERAENLTPTQQHELLETCQSQAADAAEDDRPRSERRRRTV